MSESTIALPPADPAIRSYWFRKAYLDLFHTIRDGWQLNSTVARDQWRLSAVYYDSRIRRFVQSTFYRVSAASVMIFGTLLYAVLSILHIAIVATVAAAIGVAFVTVWGIEKLYVTYRGWTCVCPHCVHKIALPV